MDTDFSKRVYQGVRVKHTVKDLLAEKRSQQTNGTRYSAGSTPSSSFVQMPGSHMLPGYYSVRRPFISDSEFCSSTKQFSSDVYPSTLGAKALGCEPSAVSTYSSLIDSYYPESFSDYRSSAAFSAPGSSFLPSSALSSLLPSYTGEASQLFLRDSWEQSVPESVPQVEALCPDTLVPPSLSSPEPPGSPTQYRSPSRGSSMGSQSYTLHSLEDAHYHSLTPTSTYAGPSASYACPAYMSASVGDLMSKMVVEEDADGHAGLTADGNAPPCWPKEDGVSAWSTYEIRRAF